MNFQLYRVKTNIPNSSQVVKEAIAAGVDGYDADIKKSVRKAAHGLRLTREAAMSIASKAVSNHLVVCYFNYL